MIWGRSVVSILSAVLTLGAWAVSAQAAEGLSAPEIQRALDRYLADSPTPDARLVGGPGTAGYDDGFYIRGGDFLLRTNITLQARFEAMDWMDTEPQGANGGGDLSGFSLPRATVKFSGEAPCNIRYYVELEFGHFGRRTLDTLITPNPQLDPPNLGPQNQSNNFDNTREAWIEWSMNSGFNFRMGQIRTATTRQLMTAPEFQQFVDISLASAFVGLSMPGYTDRNRDHGFMIHGSLGCDEEFSYMLAVTNGDGGDSIRNVLDHRSSDNLAYSARINWAFLKWTGYEEGALRQDTCSWYGEIGAWAYYYADRRDKLHAVEGDFLRYGVDLALGYGGFSMTAAISFQDDSDVATVPASANTLNDEATAFLIQMGYHFPGTAWEIAARYSGYDTEGDVLGNGQATEIAFAINYYLNGHGNKLTLDASFISTEDAGFLIFDRYAGYGNFLTNNEDGLLLRFQWQLAL